MSADDEIRETRSAMDAAAELIARIKKDRESRGNDVVDEPDDGGRRQPARQKATRTLRTSRPPVRSSGVSGAGF